MSAKIFYPSLKNLEVVDLIILRFTEGSTNNEVIIFKSKNFIVHMKIFTLKKIKFEGGFFCGKKMIKLNTNLDHFSVGISFGHLIN